MKTERLVTLVSREQAKAVAARAKAMRISTGEYVRQAIEAYDPQLHQELAVLAKELHESVARAKASMKRLRDDEVKRAKPATAKKNKELANVN